jgi:hypothetical protein
MSLPLVHNFAPTTLHEVRGAAFTSGVERVPGKYAARPECGA